MQYSVDEAIRVVHRAGLIGHVPPGSEVMVIYAGDRDDRDTWEYRDRVVIFGGRVSALTLAIALM